MATMLDGAHFEALAAVAFVSPPPPPAFGHLLAAADRGVQVRLTIGPLASVRLRVSTHSGSSRNACQVLSMASALFQHIR
jgi:hypothetical protein